VKRAAILVLLAACGSKPTPHDAGPIVAPSPVALAQVDAAALRPIVGDAYVVIDASGTARAGQLTAANPTYGGDLVRRGPENSYTANYDADAFGTLTRHGEANVLVLADATAPARIALWFIARHLQPDTALAANDSSHALSYRFGANPAKDAKVVEITDTSTTGELLAALGKLAAAGVTSVRVHRMMGWAGVPASEVVDLAGPTADDDVFGPGPPAKIEVSIPEVDGDLRSPGVQTALYADTPRFRYCFEKSGTTLAGGVLELSFDVTDGGAIANAAATGLTPEIQSCVAGAIFDLVIDPDAARGAGHVNVQLAINVTQVDDAAPMAKARAYWCWQADEVGLCAPTEETCDASRDGYENTGLNPDAHASPCKRQKSAWRNDSAVFPTKKLCGTGCKEIR
jgi:hypothetical protein